MNAFNVSRSRWPNGTAVCRRSEDDPGEREIKRSSILNAAAVKLVIIGVFFLFLLQDLNSSDEEDKKKEKKKKKKKDKKKKKKKKVCKDVNRLYNN